MGDERTTDGDAFAYAAMTDDRCRCCGRVFRIAGDGRWHEFVIGSDRWVPYPDGCHGKRYRIVDEGTARQLIHARRMFLILVAGDAALLARQVEALAARGDDGDASADGTIGGTPVPDIVDRCPDLDAKTAAWLYAARLAGVKTERLARIGFPSDIVGAVRLLADDTPPGDAQPGDTNGTRDGDLLSAEERIAAEVLAAWSLMCPDSLAHGEDDGMPRAATA